MCSIPPNRAQAGKSLERFQSRNGNRSLPSSFLSSVCDRPKVANPAARPTSLLSSMPGGGERRRRVVVGGAIQPGLVRPLWRRPATARAYEASRSGTLGPMLMMHVGCPSSPSRGTLQGIRGVVPHSIFTPGRASLCGQQRRACHAACRHAKLLQLRDELVKASSPPTQAFGVRGRDIESIPEPEQYYQALLDGIKVGSHIPARHTVNTV
jgi:hypothetical protein